MSIWKNDVQGLIPDVDWLEAGAVPPIRPNDPLDALFGDIKTDNMVAMWHSIASMYQVPMMAQFHAFDTKAQKTVSFPIDTRSVEKGLIKVVDTQSELKRQLLRSGVIKDEELKRFLFNDGMRLADQVITRTKVAKAEVMATGQVTIKENNLDLTVTYGVSDDQKNRTLDLSADSDIPAQIQAIVDTASASGVTLTGFITAKQNITKMRRNTAIQKAINGNIGVGALVSAAAIKAYLETEFGLTYTTHDLQYGIPTGIDADGRPTISMKRYFPTDKVSFFAANSAGKMGDGLWGDPPETDAGMFYNVSTSDVSPYVYIMQWMEKDPAILNIKASTLFMPVLYNPSSLWIATVVEGK